DRYPSAVAFARALQKVQIELAHSVTPIDIVDEHPSSDELRDDDDGLTRVREVQSISPDTPAATRPSAATEPRLAGGGMLGVPRFEAPAPQAAEEHTVRRGAAPEAPADDDDRTLLRPPTILTPSAPSAPGAPGTSSPAPPEHTTRALADETPSSNRRGVGPWLWAAAAAVVIVVGGGIWLGGSLSTAARPTAAPVDDEPAPQDVISGIVPPVDDLTGTRSGDTVTFTWSNPSPEEGDSYIWAEVTLDGTMQAQTTEKTTVTLEGSHPGRTCIEVSLVRADRRSAQEVRECVE
ncbi:MAG: serine/threonine protein kinase, partial [Actinomycetota bacterium]|nr:serine/threonine protein kinase [Actinomycetota bacterium]